jgi:hypothetical protein
MPSRDGLDPRIPIPNVVESTLPELLVVFAIVPLNQP